MKNALDREKLVESRRHNETTEHTQAVRAAKTGSGRSGGGRGSKNVYTWYDTDGNAHTATTKDEADNQAKNAGTYGYKPVTSTHTDARGRTTTTTRNTGYRAKPNKTAVKGFGSGGSHKIAIKGYGSKK